MVIRNDYSNYGIPQLRQQSLFGGQDYGMSQDYGMGMGEEDPYSQSYAPRAQVDAMTRGQMRDPSPSPFAPRIDPRDTGDEPWYGGSSEGAPPNQVAAPTVKTYEHPSETDSLRRFTNAVNSVYSPDFTDRDRLRALMDAAPQREEPGFGRRLTAAAMGFRQKPEDTLKIQEEVMYAPHRRAMTDWTAKTEPFTKIAEIEGRQNVNERTLAGNMVNAVTQGDRIEQQRVRDEGKQKVAEQNAESTRIRATAYDFRQRHPDWKFDFSGPRVMAYPPGGGAGVDLGATAHMSDIDKINLQNKGKLEAAQALGGAYFADPNNPTAPTSQNNPRLQGNIPPPGYRPLGTAAGKPEKELSPADTEKARENEAMRLYRTSKDTSVKKWTKVQGGKVVPVDRPEPGSMPWSWSQSDTDDYDRVMEMMWPDPSSNTNRSPDQANSRAQQEDAGTTTDRGVAAGVNGRQKAADVTKPPPPSEATPRSPFDTDPTAGLVPSFSPSGPARKGQVISGDDRARQAIYGKIAEQRASRPAELEKMLADPSTPNQIKPAIQRELDGIRQREASSQIKSFTDANNPNNKRRTSDGGKTWEYSTDGGNSWIRGQ